MREAKWFLAGMLVVFVLAAPAHARRKKLTPLFSGVLIAQPADGIHGDSITWTDSAWAVQDHDGVAQVGKGIDVADSSAGGTLLLHLWEAPTGVYIKVKLGADTRTGYLFDTIHQWRDVSDTLCRKDLIVWY